jgi:hypothetical protein
MTIENGYQDICGNPANIPNISTSSLAWRVGTYV